MTTRNLTEFSNILKQEGTSRYERYLPALDPASVKLDDRKLHDFILYAQRYSKNLLFVDTEGEVKPDDNWEYFFKNENIVLLIAGIAGKKVQDLRFTYDQLQQQFAQEKTTDSFTELMNFVFARFKQFSNWYYATSPDTSLKADLTLYIQSYLQKELISLKEIVFYIRDQGNSNYNLNDFLREFYANDHVGTVKDLLQRDDVWEIGTRENMALRERIFAGNNEEEKLESASVVLNRIFDSVFHATETIVNNCKDYFEEVITQKHDHPPHIAFLIVFIKLYGYVQEELNKIPQRHLDYYYTEVLRIKRKEAIPDQAFVVFDLAKGFDGYELKKGTPLTAGKDKLGMPLVYETNDDLVVNGAQVASLHTVFIQQAVFPDLGPRSQTLNYYAAAIEATEPPPGGAAPSWSMFGEPRKEGLSGIGFGIASTQFYLAKGERNVTITFQVQAGDMLDDFHTGYEFDTGILNLLLTGEKGWINSEDAKAGVVVKSLKKTGSQTVELAFTVSVTQESAVIAFNPKLHAGNFDTAFPVLQCLLKYPPSPEPAEEQVLNQWKNTVRQLNALQRLKITATTIRVQVGSLQAGASFDGIRDLFLENSDAPLDSKKPFYPFTAVPKVGSSFYIGCKDLYYKSIQQLLVNIEWALPDDFDAYYEKYLPPYDANKFRASLSILQNKHWQKVDEISVIDKDASEARYKVVKIDGNKAPVTGKWEQPVAAFDNDRQDGTIRLELLYPDFGHGVYPQLITSAVMEKAASKSSSVDYFEIVKKQLKDSAISIKLPDRLDQRDGPLRVIVYEILDKVHDTKRAKEGMVKGMSDMIQAYNGSNVVVKNPADGPVPVQEGDEARRAVNDDNLVERVLRFLKKIKIIDRRVHYDKDKENADQVVDAMKDRLTTKADFIMPSDKALVNVILQETNNAINKTVANVVDEILDLKAKGTLEPNVVADLLRKEFDETNQVINDIIARKIAILLSANEIPPPPYTPLVNAISLSYSSVKSSEAGGDQFYHITPLGVFKLDVFKQAERNGTAPSIFPKSIVALPDVEAQMQGMLFLGVANAKPRQNLTMLVVVAEGTKMNDKKPPPVNWWCLQNYTWVKLKDDNIVSDTTYGLQTTGIVEISLPGDATSESTIFNTGSLLWLCAGVTGETDAFPRLAAVKTQAVAVTFKDRHNDPAHHALPLEAGKITGLVNNVPQVRKVSQPVASFGGEVKEDGPEYYMRVSERLRHKNRAINNWDYERLVLDNFSFVFKVKCLNNYYAGHFAAGHVTVVPIANLTNKNDAGSNLLIPRTSYIDLVRIERFLTARASPFVKIHAVNPLINRVLIHCRVKFHTGVDKGYYLQQLNQDLITFLTPWALGEAGAFSFSAKIYASSILNFIDKRPYVDYVTDLVMEQYTEDEKGEKDFFTGEDELTNLAETQITSGHSILVSAGEHDIRLVEDAVIRDRDLYD